jgi:hypothetical protein
MRALAKVLVGLAFLICALATVPSHADQLADEAAIQQLERVVQERGGDWLIIASQNTESMPILPGQ